jgi:uncharacterized protein YndB with AHSA1/START domain
MPTTTVTDRIEKQIVLRAPRSKVWRALTTPEQFSAWFGANVAGPFTPGARVRGPVTHKGYEHVMMDFTIERMEPERLLSWRWPHPLDLAVEEPSGPRTLVTFELTDVPEGTLLTVVESGFDALPLDRRQQRFRENEGGWAAQMESIKRHVDQAP